MATYSHVDTLLFHRYMDMASSDIPESVVHVLRNNDASKSVLNEAFGQQFAESRSKMLHEAYHYWQGLMLPYLHRRAVLGHRIILRAFRELSKRTSNYIEWSCQLTGFSSLSEKSHLIGRPGTSEFTIIMSDDDKSPPSNVTLAFSPLDMLENAASIAEFQFQNTGPDAFDPDKFKKWCIRNPAYDSIQKYVQSCLRDKVLAFRMTLCLINVSFHTTQPTRAFALLLKYFHDSFDDDLVLCEKIAQGNPYKLRTLFESMLDQLDMDDKDDANADFYTSSFHKINIRTWAGGSFGNLPSGIDIDHPFISKDTATWLDAIDSGRHEFLALLDHPGILLEREVDLVAQHFSPPLTLAKFQLSEMNSRVLIWGDLKRISKAYRDVFSPAELLTIYSMVKQSASINVENRSRLCSHTNCPNFKKNYCNMYPGIPEDFEKCEFPNIAHFLVNTINQI
jgi:hypothetical protein